MYIVNSFPIKHISLNKLNFCTLGDDLRGSSPYYPSQKAAIYNFLHFFFKKV